jgi:hypothetical protein
MMVAFLLATALSIYKVYVIFEKQAGEGPSIQEIEQELSNIIEELISAYKSEKKELFAKVFEHQKFDKERYKNFNENRFNQILDGLYIKHKVEDYEGLKEKL